MGVSIDLSDPMIQAARLGDGSHLTSREVRSMVLAEQGPDYPLWWELLPPLAFHRLKNEWDKQHERSR